MGPSLSADSVSLESVQHLALLKLFSRASRRYSIQSECLSANQCHSDGVCHQPDNYLYLSWVSSCGCVFLRCVQQANACRGESLRKERVTLNCRGTSIFYNHVSDNHVDLSALLNKDVPRLHILARRPPLGPSSQNNEYTKLIPIGTVVVGHYASCSRGSPQSHVKSS